MTSNKKNSKRGGKREGAGRPKNGDYPKSIFLRVSDEHKEFVKSIGGDTKGVRRLIDYAIAHNLIYDEDAGVLVERLTP